MLTNEQITTVRGAIFNDPAAAAMLAAGNWPDLMAWLNAPSDPAFTCWRTSVTDDEIMQNGFDWVRVDNLSVGKARIWEWLFDNDDGAVNPSKPNVRAGIDEVWKGTAADLAVRAAVYAHCKRVARRVERILATGTGSDVDPGQFVFEGEATQFDVVRLVFRDDGSIWTPQG